VILALGLLTAAALAAPPRLLGRGRLAVAIAAVATGVALAAPAAYSVQTASTAHTGAIPSAGPAGASRVGGPGRVALPAGARPFAGGGRGVGGAGAPGLGFGGQGGSAQGFTRPSANPTRGAGRARLGGLLDSSTPNAALVKLLKADVSGYTWIAAAVGANSAAGVELATDEPVLAIGGFNGTDPAPTLARFEALVSAGRIHYFLAGDLNGPAAGRSGSSSSAIAGWVEQHFAATTVGGVTVYDLTTAAS
jgi:hypothetical protein